MVRADRKPHERSVCQRDTNRLALAAAMLFCAHQRHTESRDALSERAQRPAGRVCESGFGVDGRRAPERHQQRDMVVARLSASWAFGTLATA